MAQKVHPVRVDFQLPISEHKSVDRFVHAYLVLGEQVCVVDTGVAGAQQPIIDVLDSLGKSLTDVAWVVNTHAHADHIGGNSVFRDAAQPAFMCHVKAVRWMENLDLQYQERPVNGFYELAGEPTAVTRQVEHGDEIDLGAGTTLQVVFTPGHSPGSMSLLCPQDGSLITADAIPPVGGLPLYEDVSQVRQSLQRLSSLTGVKTLYRSHSEKPYTDGEIANVIQAGLDYVDRVDSVVSKVVDRLPADASPEEITREALIRLGLPEPPVMPITVAGIMAHLA